MNSCKLTSLTLIHWQKMANYVEICINDHRHNQLGGEFNAPSVITYLTKWTKVSFCFIDF